MIAASIDIGTNTTLALLAERDGGGLRVLQDQLAPNRLGEALGRSLILPRDVMSLNVDLLAELVRDFRRAGAEAFAITGTAALRRAENRAEFLAAAHEIVGAKIEVIGGREEAALTYMGALSNREIFPGERVCVMDLGGGSTEIIEGHGMVAGQGYSMDVGSVYLTNEFFHSDPPTIEEVSSLRENLRGRLPSLVSTLRGANCPWIFVGGTAVTLAILKSGLRRYDPQAVGGSLLTAKDVDAQIFSFAGRSSQELQNLPGMPMGRGKSILAGAILLREMMDALELEQGIVSERGLRHGVWLAKFAERGLS